MPNCCVNCCTLESCTYMLRMANSHNTLMYLSVRNCCVTVALTQPIEKARVAFTVATVAHFCKSLIHNVSLNCCTVAPQLLHTHRSL